jgi:hypothetical protein
MSDQQRMADIEVLARMAARLAGRDPDEHLRIEMAGVVPFDDPLWRYHDFQVRAEAAYHALAAPHLTLPPSLNGRQHPAITRSRRIKSGDDEKSMAGPDL